MDKIWYRNPSKSEVICRCGGDEKTECPRRTDKSWMLKKQKNKKNYNTFQIDYISIHTQLILSYHCCYIWQKSAWRVYYNYLRQAIHGRVTSQVNIPKMQMAPFFLSIQKFGWWITLFGCINVATNNCCVITIGKASPCITLSNLPNILKCTKTGT